VPAPGDALLALLERERAAFLAEVARVERGVAKLFALRAAEPLAATPDQLAHARLTPERAAWVRGRAERLQAPERVRPAGALSPEAALEQLAAARAALAAAYLAAQPAVLDGAVYPHPVLGPLTLRSWVELVAHHDARHALQVAELARACEPAARP
jgi:hypothetical protein